MFLGAHLGFDYPGAWIHVDMASPVESVSMIFIKIHNDLIKGS